jgi:hypothetical protein
MASLDLQKPAVLFKMYVKTKEKSENWDKHCELIISRHREPNMGTEGKRGRFNNKYT